MLEMLKKVSWQERVKMLEDYQKQTGLSLRALAEEFDYSLGKMSYELNLAAALEIYPELKNMVKITSAIKFIKRKKFHRELD